MNQVVCSKCSQTPSPEQLMPIKNENDITLYFCKSCLKNAADLLSMKLIQTKEEKKLLRDIRKWLKHEKN